MVQGQLVSGEAAEGVVRRADDVRAVLALMQSDSLDETILLVESASATAVVPLLAKVRGVVCSSGGPTSHLALVAREFGLLCVMGAEAADPAALDGCRVRVGPDGTLTGL